MTYTEADVERDAETALAAVDGHLYEHLLSSAGVHFNRTVATGRSAVDRLKAAALEGAKVPALVADNAALLAFVRSQSEVACEDVQEDLCGACCSCLARKLMADQHPGAALLAEHEAKVAAIQAQVAQVAVQRDELARWQGRVMDAAQKAVDYELETDRAVDVIRAMVAEALEAEQVEADLRSQVATLTAERDALKAQHGRQMLGARQAVEAVRELQRHAEAERDYLRAQVEAMREAGAECLDWLDCDPREEDLAARARLRATLSAPTAETKED